MTTDPTAALAALEAELDRHVDELFDDAVAARRYLHQHPELGWEEIETQRYLRSWLQRSGLEPSDCATTGLVLDVGPAGRTVLYRGDIDALPITEANDVPYASRIRGRCHACGHDAHAAVAGYLATAFGRMADRLPGRVRFVFQPAEEVVPSGAEAMIREGAARGIEAAFAIHVDPARDVGHVGVRVGALTSATDTFAIRVQGKSGHSARPYLARDAILAAADLVRSLYTLIGQRVNPMSPAVLNVGTIHGGEAKNVIAGEVHLDGVVRTLHADVRHLLHTEMRDVAEAVARVHGCRVELTIATGAPPVTNDPVLHAIVVGAASHVLGGENVQEIEHPSTGAEDFGMFGVHVPQYMMRVGVRAPGAETNHLHTPRFDVDESALRIAARIMGRVLLRALVAPA